MRVSVTLANAIRRRVNAAVDKAWDSTELDAVNKQLEEEIAKKHEIIEKLEAKHTEEFIKELREQDFLVDEALECWGISLTVNNGAKRMATRKGEELEEKRDALMKTKPNAQAIADDIILDLEMHGKMKMEELDDLVATAVAKYSK